MGMISVNKSGKSINVYSQMNGGGSVIGQIVPNEVYTVVGRQGSGVAVAFKAPNGTFRKDGYLDGTVNLPSGHNDWITDYPYGRHNGNYTFMLRRSANFKTANGSNAGTIPSGTTIVCKDATAGQTYPDYLHMIGTLSGSTFTAKEGFIEMGFQYGSSNSKLTVYGKF